METSAKLNITECLWKAWRDGKCQQRLLTELVSWMDKKHIWGDATVILE